MLSTGPGCICIGAPCWNSTNFKKLLDVAALAFVLTTNTGSSFNLSAPGAFSFANPDALSNSDVSTLLFTIDSFVAIPTTSSLGLLVYFDTMMFCSAILWKFPFWKIIPSCTDIWNDLPNTFVLASPSTSKLELAIVTFPVLTKFTFSTAPLAVPFSGTIVAVGKSSIENPDPLDVTLM